MKKAHLLRCPRPSSALHMGLFDQPGTGGFSISTGPFGKGAQDFCLTEVKNCAYIASFHLEKDNY